MFKITKNLLKVYCHRYSFNFHLKINKLNEMEKKVRNRVKLLKVLNLKTVVEYHNKHRYSNFHN